MRSFRMELRVAAWSYRGDPACDRAQVADPLDPRHCLAVNKHLDNNTELFVAACCIEFVCIYQVRLYFRTKIFIIRGSFPVVLTKN